MRENVRKEISAKFVVYSFNAIPNGSPEKRNEKNENKQKIHISSNGHTHLK